MNSKKAIWISLPLLLLAVALFSHKMASFPLWQDEGWGIFASHQPNISAIIDFAVMDSHPPGYPILLHFWGEIFGREFFLLRSLNFFASVIGVAVTYRLALDVFDLRTAVVAVIIVATSDLVIALTPAARHYGFFMLFSAIGAWTYWRYTTQWSVRWALAFAINGILGLTMIYWMAFVLLGFGLHFMLYYPRRFKWILLPALAISVFFAMLIPHLLRGADFAYSDQAGGFHSALMLNRTGIDILLFQYFGVPEALFIFLSLAGLASNINLQRYLPDKRTLFLGLWMWIPILVPVFISAFFYNILVERPLIALVPPMGILIGHVFQQMNRWQYNLVLSIIVINNLTTVGSVHRGAGPWWEIANLLKQNFSPEDALLIHAGFDAYSIQEHAELAGVPVQFPIRAAQITSGFSGEEKVELADLIRPHESIWYVDAFSAQEYLPLLQSLGYVQTTPSTMFNAPAYPFSATVTRYAIPPTGEPQAVYNDVLRLWNIDHFQQNGQLHVDLTWDAAIPPGVDYTVSTFLLAPDGRLVAQHDSYPLDTASPTSQWQPGGWYFDRHNLDISTLPSGNYQIGIKVYTWWDGAVQPVEPCEVPDCAYFVVDQVQIE